MRNPAYIIEIASKLSVWRRDGDRYHVWPIRMQVWRKVPAMRTLTYDWIGAHGWQTGTWTFGKRIFGWTLALHLPGYWTVGLMVGPSTKKRKVA